MNENAPPCEVLVDSAPRSGRRNMELDERLLDQVTREHSTSYVRIYRWSEPTVSLGYFQAADQPIDSRISQCPRVKRLTGGGAILHDNELTYSIALPSIHPLTSNPVELYELVHEAVINLLGSLGVESSLRKNQQGTDVELNENEPFLCFLRSDPRDVVHGRHKILGSAQRRRRGSILQHGSILVKSSTLIPEIVGIAECATAFDQNQFAAELPLTVARTVAQRLRIIDPESNPDWLGIGALK